MGNLTPDANDNMAQCTQRQSEGCNASGCSDSDTEKPIIKQGSTSRVPGKKDAQNLMVRLPLGVAVLRDPAFNKA
jgi:hypothetical protein